MNPNSARPTEEVGVGVEAVNVELRGRLESMFILRDRDVTCGLCVEVEDPELVALIEEVYVSDELDEDSEMVDRDGEGTTAVPWLPI